MSADAAPSAPVPSAQPGGGIVEVAFRLEHDCALAKISRRFPEDRLLEWCNNVVEVIHIEAHPDRLPVILDAVRAEGRVIEAGGREGTGFVLRECACARFHSLLHLIESAGCIPLFPLEFKSGWERYRALSMSPEKLRRLMDALAERAEVELVAKRAITGPAAARMIFAPVHELFHGVTEKQAGALQKAYEHGYYEDPRRISAGKIATRLGMSPSTYKDHLKKGEDRLVGNLAPYLDLWARGLPVAPSPKPQEGAAWWEREPVRAAGVRKRGRADGGK